MLGDVIDASRELLAGAQVAPRIILLADREVADFGSVSSRWYIRLEVDDSPGVLAAIAGVFGESGVSLGSVWQEGRGDQATLILITHDATEDSHRQAVDASRGAGGRQAGRGHDPGAWGRSTSRPSLMRYLSTRGDPGRPGFEQVLVDGLAPDGGLFMPEAWPLVDLPVIGRLSRRWWPTTMRPFVAPDPLEQDLGSITESAYSGFRHPEVAPLREVGEGRYLLELFWGPTLSFKDYALSVVGRMFDLVLSRIRWTDCWFSAPPPGTPDRLPSRPAGGERASMW